MRLEDSISKFIERPFPLWETNLTQELVLNKWKQLQQFGLTNRDDYTTARIWLNNPLLQPDKKILTTEGNGENTFLEMPSPLLKSFYEEHGLEILCNKESESVIVLKKLQSAFKILQQVKPVYDCITTLVRTIQVLRTDDPEIDLSYSHPKIPFSIFVSVCEDASTISNLRVAESILHEAMHLKLTLIEEIVPLVLTSTAKLYYSPWKNEQRSTQGVLHGLFVFRVIYEFWKELDRNNDTPNPQNFFCSRKREIEREIISLKDFNSHIGLTEYGASLAINLLPLS